MTDVRSTPATWSDRFRVAGIYLAIILAVNLLWEILHLPLYSIWKQGSAWEQAVAVAHCTAGDVLIVSAALVLAVLSVGGRQWPSRHFLKVAFVASFGGIVYTAYSEWQHVHLLRSWSYSELMPIISVAGVEIGASPLLQWCILPPLAFVVAWRHLAKQPQPKARASSVQ